MTWQAIEEGRPPWLDLLDALMRMPDLVAAERVLDERSAQVTAANVASIIQGAGGVSDPRVALHVLQLACLAADRVGSAGLRGEARQQLGLVLAELRKFERGAAAQFDAAKLFAAAGNIWAQAYSLSRLGLCLEDLGRLEEAFVVFGESAACFQQAGDPRCEVLQIGSAGIVLAALGNLHDAVECHRAAWILADAHGLALEGAFNRRKEANALISAGRGVEALVAFRQAVERYRGIGDRDTSGWVLVELARAMRETVTPTPSVDHIILVFEEAAQAFSESEDAHGMAEALAGLAETHFSRGDVKAALRARGLAREALTGVVEPRELMVHLFDTALLLERFGYIAEEAHYLDAARTGFMHLGDDDGTAAAFLRIGILAFQRKGDGTALPAFEEAARLWAMAKRPSNQAMALVMAGICLADSGETAEARRRLDCALVLSELGGDDEDEDGAGLSSRGAALAALADIDASVGDLQTAAERFDDAIAEFRAPAHGGTTGLGAGASIIEGDLLRRRARVRLALGDRLGAFDDLQRCVVLFRKAGRDRSAVTTEIEMGLALDQLGEGARAAAILRPAASRLVELVASGSTVNGVDGPDVSQFGASRVVLLETSPDLIIVGVNAFDRLAEVNISLGAPFEALAVARAGLQLAVEAGNVPGQAHLAMLVLDLSCRFEPDLAIAQAAASAAVGAAEALGDREMVGFALATAADISRCLGNLDDAARDVARSLEIFSMPAHPGGLCNVHRQLGLLARARGDLAVAVEHLEASRQLASTMGVHAEEVAALSALSLVHGDAGDFQAALEACTAGLDALRPVDGVAVVGTAEAEASLLANRAGLFFRMGDLWRSEGDNRLALEKYQELGDLSAQAARLADLGLVRSAIGDLAEARRLIGEALIFERASGRTREAAIDLMNLGGIAHRDGDTATARASYDESLLLYRQSGFRIGELEVLMNLGQLDLSDGDAATAYSRLTEAIDGLGTLGAARGLAYAYHGRSLANEELGDMVAAFDDCCRAVDELDELHRVVAVPSQRLMLAGPETAAIRDRAVDLASRLQRPAAALAFAERARSRVLTEQLGHARWLPPVNADPDLLEAETSLLAQVRRSDIALFPDGTSRSGDERLRQERARTVLGADLGRAWDRLEASAPGYVALRRGQPVRTNHVSGLLHAALVPPPGSERVGLIEIHVLDQAVVVLAASTGDDAPRLFRLPVDKSVLRGRLLPSLRREVGNYPRHLAARLRVGNLWQELGPLLLEEVLSALGPLDLLYVAPHGPLYHLPFQALTVGGVPLVDLCPVAYVTGVAALAQYQARQPFDVRGPVVAVGYTDDPDERADFEGEAQDVARLMGGESRLGADATGEWLALHAGEYRVIHLSCHGRFDDHNPLGAAVLLADGAFTARQVMALPLDGALVTLSACDTGVSGHLWGEEVMGLDRSLLLAGAATAVLTLWPVDASATRAAMGAFYRRLASPDCPGPASALQSAMLEVRGTPGWEHPYYWAAFIALGQAGAVPVGST